MHEFGLQSAEEAEQKQQPCGAGGRQHLGKKQQRDSEAALGVSNMHVSIYTIPKSTVNTDNTFHLIYLLSHLSIIIVVYLIIFCFTRH